MLKVLSIFGTRPEAIKMAPVIQELERRSDLVVSRVCVTGQHRQMLDQVLQIFQTRPDYDLDLIEASQSPAQVAAAVLSGEIGTSRQSRCSPYAVERERQRNQLSSPRFGYR